MSVDGGVSVNPYFCQFLADVLGKCVAVKTFPEITAVDTAQLAGAGDIRRGEDLTPVRRYLPGMDRQSRENRAARFTEAVSRAGRWRKPPTGP